MPPFCDEAYDEKICYKCQDFYYMNRETNSCGGRASLPKVPESQLRSNQVPEIVQLCQKKLKTDMCDECGSYCKCGESSIGYYTNGCLECKNNQFQQKENREQDFLQKFTEDKCYCKLNGCASCSISKCEYCRSDHSFSQNDSFCISNEECVKDKT